MVKAHFSSHSQSSSASCHDINCIFDFEFAFEEIEEFCDRTCLTSAGSLIGECQAVGF